MKNLLKLSFKMSVVSKLSMLSILLAMAFLCISCDENTFKTQSEAETEVEASPTDNIHVAFAGGGWRAHTGHSAWTMSLLENNNYKLDNVFKNVESIGSNSGGSWFSTMLMYSPQFVADIETLGAIKTWGNTTSDGGWLGGQQLLFDAATYADGYLSCTDFSGDPFVACVINNYDGGRHEDRWDKVITGLVFKDYSDVRGKQLNGTRTTWANGKSLLLASTMLTNNVVLNSSSRDGYDGYNQYYQACLNDAVVLHGKNGGSRSNGIPPDVTPVTFSSIQSPNLNIINPPFFPEAGTTKGFHIGYSQQKDSPNTGDTIVKNKITSDQVEVMYAAAASSAATGFAASENVSGSWDGSYAASNLALNFSLEKAIAKFKIAKNGTHVSDLTSSQTVSLADGGPTDNSGVAQLVSFLQLNNKDTGFNIVAFDNVQGPPFIPRANNAAVGSDFANLFGYGKDLCSDDHKFCTKPNCKGYCVTVPKVQIFKSSNINESITWQYSPRSSNESNKTPKLIYTKYTVTTTENSAFGIKKGSTGTLHAFTCYYPDAPTEPQNEKTNGSSFKAYNDMIQFINKGLKAKGNKGLTHLETAMGLK